MFAYRSMSTWIRLAEFLARKRREEDRHTAESGDADTAQDRASSDPKPEPKPKSKTKSQGWAQPARSAVQRFG
jgi:hypothetical protein